MSVLVNSDLELISLKVTSNITWIDSTTKANNQWCCYGFGSRGQPNLYKNTGATDYLYLTSSLSPRHAAAHWRTQSNELTGATTNQLSASCPSPVTVYSDIHYTAVVDLCDPLLKTGRIHLPHTPHAIGLQTYETRWRQVPVGTQATYTRV